MIKFIKYLDYMINLDKIVIMQKENDNKVIIKTDKGNVLIRTSNHPGLTAGSLYSIIIKELKENEAPFLHIIDLDHYMEQY